MTTLKTLMMEQVRFENGLLAYLGTLRSIWAYLFGSILG